MHPSGMLKSLPSWHDPDCPPVVVIVDLFLSTGFKTECTGKAIEMEIHRLRIIFSPFEILSYGPVHHGYIKNHI